MNELPEMCYSKKVKAIPEALSVYINNLVYQMKHRGEKVTTLSLGEAYFDFPFYGFDESEIKAGYHYSESRGLPGLREKIAKYYHERYGADINWESEVLVSAGSKPLTFMALLAILEEGDEVLLFEPAWLSYPEQIKLAGGTPVFIPYDFRISDFNKYITDRTKALIINNPNNPAGRVYSRTDLESLYRLCRSHGIWLIVDEAYSDFVLDDSFASILNIASDKDGVIVVNSLSKNFGISGWRIGYIIGTEKTIYHILKLNQHLLTCTSTLLLIYVEKHFKKLLEYTLPQARAVTAKRNAIEQYIREIGLETLGGTSTFYIFVDIGSYRRSSFDLAMQLLFVHHIAVVPGLAYGESTDRFIRIGVGTASEESMKEAMDTIRETILHQEYDESLIMAGLSELGAFNMDENIGAR